MPRGIPNPTTHVDAFENANEALITGFENVPDYTQFRLNTDNQIVVVSEREFKDMGEYDEFMKNRLVITVHESTDPNAPPYAPVGVNGEQAWLPRGQPVRVPRYMVERLARSRPVSIKTKNNPDPSADVGMLTVSKTGFDYPFSVNHDPHPKGRAWLARVVAEGQRA